MKSNFEIKCHKQRESAEALLEAELGDDALNVTYSFANLECVIDVQVKDQAVSHRYVLIEDEDGDKLRRIA